NKPDHDAPEEKPPPQTNPPAKARRTPTPTHQKMTGSFAPPDLHHPAQTGAASTPTDSRPPDAKHPHPWAAPSTPTCRSHTPNHPGSTGKDGPAGSVRHRRSGPGASWFLGRPGPGVRRSLRERPGTLLRW